LELHVEPFDSFLERWWFCRLLPVRAQDAREPCEEKQRAHGGQEGDNPP